MSCIAQSTVLPPLTNEQRYDLLKEASLHSFVHLLVAAPDPLGQHRWRSDFPFLVLPNRGADGPGA